MGVIQGNINQALAIGSALLSQSPMAEQQISIAEDKAKQNIAFNKAQNKIKAYEGQLNRIEEIENKYPGDNMPDKIGDEYLQLIENTPDTNVNKLFRDMYSTIEDNPKKIAKIRQSGWNEELERRAEALGVENPEIRAARKAYENALNQVNNIQRQKQITTEIRDNLKKENQKDDIFARKDIIRKV